MVQLPENALGTARSTLISLRWSGESLRRFCSDQTVAVRQLPGPVFCLIAQPAHNRVPFYVGELVRQLRFIPYAVIEEVVLPDYAVHPLVIPLPPLDRSSHAIVGTELQKGVEMVRHEQEEKAVPSLEPDIGPHRLQNIGPEAWLSQWLPVLAAAAYPDMKHGAFGYPSRDSVRKARRVVLHTNHTNGENALGTARST